MIQEKTRINTGDIVILKVNSMLSDIKPPLLNLIGVALGEEDFSRDDVPKDLRSQYIELHVIWSLEKYEINKKFIYPRNYLHEHGTIV